MKITFYFYVFIMLVLTSCQKQTKLSTEITKPNIIIFYADDMGYGDLAIQNPQSKIPTPNLDQLAKEGMLMTDAHSSSGICTPSRYALLTGRYHWRDFNDIVHSMGPTVFKENQVTLPKVLKKNGYHTAAIGKWHLGWDWEAIRKKDFTQKEKVIRRKKEFEIWPAQAYDWAKKIPSGPLSIGFDSYFGDGTINFPPYTWIENDKVTEAPTITLQHPKKEFALEGNWELRPGPSVKDWDFYKVLPTVTKSAVTFIKKQEKAKKPFFLYMAFPSPHAPIIPNKEFRRKSKAGPYGDFMYQTDDAVGQILEALKKINADENTIVIFTSDNGSEKYAYDRIKNYKHNSSNPFRGVKRDVYEGGHHVPFIVKWPNKIKAGTINHQLFSQIDILKTLSSITKSNLPKGFQHDSYNFSDVWLTDKSKPVRDVLVQNTFTSKYAIRKGDWLYINNKDGYHTRIPKWFEDGKSFETAKDSVQLFNLKKDIGQTTNLASKYPNLVKELALELSLQQKTETFKN
ncbi:sulfatase family protein [Polaribacter sp. Hel1_85]|uniref:sulfatase family protein n=1 Tax=Polaribacter sp. Hel1_85 TaxID=1250005 RepID=UPI00052DD5CE|nr:arylsulfatase [Polaribacter sp. Hel1_85]KGL62221.1 sulfatase S1-15 family [Polaribacter sp. Hel1_85]